MPNDYQPPSFPNDNSSPTSGVSGTIILQSPDNSLWKLQVNNNGALVTELVSSGTVTIVHLFSPDNTEWNVTVNNAGALITTAI